MLGQLHVVCAIQDSDAANQGVKSESLRNYLGVCNEPSSTHLRSGMYQADKH